MLNTMTVFLDDIVDENRNINDDMEI